MGRLFIIEEVPVLESGKISGSNTESAAVSEGTLYYDVRFFFLIEEESEAKEKSIEKMLVDVEPQQDPHPGYKLVTRGVVYCARMTGRLMIKWKSYRFI